jgi:L-2,4-diaminobutyric acid acetyltransferase
VLELNSCYAYVLFCRDFAETCVIAEQAGRLAGFVVAYRPPQRLGSVFVWQVGVSPHFRKQGIGVRLLRHLVALPACREVEYLEATVAPSNVASRRLFESVARQLGVTLRTESGFASSDFGAEQHEEEEMVRIGPLRSGS